MGLTIDQAPTFDLVDLDLAKLACRNDVSIEDGIIRLWIAAACRHIENLLGQTLRETTFVWTLPRFPCAGDLLQLPRPPLASVSSVQYLDQAAALQTWSAALYEVDATRMPGLLRPLPTQTWPATAERFSAVRVTFVAGYADADAVPETIRTAALQLIAHWYLNREAVGVVGVEIPQGVRDLLAGEWHGTYLGGY